MQFWLAVFSIIKRDRCIEICCRKKYIDYQIIKADQRRTFLYCMPSGFSSSLDFSICYLFVKVINLFTTSWCLTLALKLYAISTVCWYHELSKIKLLLKISC